VENHDEQDARDLEKVFRLDMSSKIDEYKNIPVVKYQLAMPIH
jgi:hypothetical protein